MRTIHGDNSILLRKKKNTSAPTDLDNIEAIFQMLLSFNIFHDIGRCFHIQQYDNDMLTAGPK